MGQLRKRQRKGKSIQNSYDREVRKNAKEFNSEDKMLLLLALRNTNIFKLSIVT